MALQVSSARNSAMRKPQAPEANRARILAAAISEFASRGFKGASMDAIAARTLALFAALPAQREVHTA